MIINELLLIMMMEAEQVCSPTSVSRKNLTLLVSHAAAIITLKLSVYSVNSHLTPHKQRSNKGTALYSVLSVWWATAEDVVNDLHPSAPHYLTKTVNRTLPEMTFAAMAQVSQASTCN